MGILGRLFRPTKHDELVAERAAEMALARIEKQGLAGFDAQWGNAWTGATTTTPARGTSELIAMYKRSPRIRAIVSKIAGMISGVEWHVGVASKGAAKALDMCSDHHERWGAFKAMAGQEIRLLENHPALGVIQGGNDFQSGTEKMQTSQTCIDLKGENYWWLMRNGAGIPISAMTIPPHWMAQVPGDGNPNYRISWGTLQRTVPPEDIVPFRDPDPYDPYGRGTGFGEALADEIDGDEYAAKFQSSMLRNRAVPIGLVGIEGADKDGVDYAQARWDEAHRGPYKAGRLKFHNGRLTFQRVAQTFEELQLIEGRDFEARVMIETFGMPPELLGRINESKRSTIDHAIYIFALTVLVPRLNRLQSTFERYLLPQYPASSSGKLVIGYTSPVPEDSERRLAVMGTAPWAFSVGEWRNEAGYQSDDKQNATYMVPANLFPSDAPPMPAKAIDCCCTPRKQALPAVIKADEPLVLNALEALRPEYLTDETVPVMNEEMQVWGNGVLASLGQDVAFDMLNPFITEHLRQFGGDRIKDLINETTKKALRSSLDEGIRAGESMVQLRARVHDVFFEGDMDINNYRAWRIARTETIRSSNAATFQAHKQSGVVAKRQWLAALVNTRPEHERINGQIRDIDKPFEVDGYFAMYPGDFGTGHLDINCMCTTIAVIGEPKSGDALLKAHELYVQEIAPWQLRLQSAFTRGFQRQYDEVLNVLGGES